MNHVSNQFDRVNVEIINTCNLKCSFCPTPDRPKEMMSPERFFGIARSLKGRTKELVLHLLGEPLSHPDLGGILSAAADAQLPIHVVTNGVLLAGARIDLLLRPVVRQVSLSLQSYGDNFRDQDPRGYLGRIKSFADRALEDRPDLYVNFRFWDVGSTADMAVESHAHTLPNQEMRDGLAEVLGFNWSDVRVNLKRRKSHRLRGRQYLHFDSRFTWPSMENQIIQSKGFCHALTGHFGIHADGTVVPCCLDHRGDIPLGNAFETPLAEILNSERAVAMREGFKQKVLVEELCKRCGYIGRFS